MASETQLNKELVGGNATVINRSFQQNGSATVINPIAASTSELIAGQILCGKYSVVKKMDIVTGEADLYLVECNNVQYVAKIYRRKVAIKPEISQKLMNIKSKYVAAIYETGEVNGFPMDNNVQYVAKIYRRKVAIKPEISQKLMNIKSKYVAAIYETGEVNGFPMEIIPYYRYGSLRRKVAIKPEISQKLMNIKSKYVAAIYETGEVNGFPMEIIPYYRYGSLQGRKYTYEQLKRDVIPSLNEGLKVLHENGILHKDLKPSNIMVGDNLKDVAIIDFGISSAREDNNTIIVTKTGMTPEYSAPETFRNLFLEESDYYSLGITLYELFCGYTPYNNMEQEAIEQYISVQRIPFPDEMPEDLQNLIAACTYYDITNRKNKSNPNRRWTYEEVKKWCNGIKQAIPGEGIGNAKVGDMNPYKFMGETYVEVAELTKALALNWNEGKKQLFRGILSGFFKVCNPELAGFCIDAEEEATRINGRDDMIFWKLLYKLSPNTTDFYWKGRAYQGLPALGREILEKLWKSDTSSDSYYYEILEEKMLSNYVAIKADKNKALADADRI